MKTIPNPMKPLASGIVEKVTPPSPGDESANPHDDGMWPRMLSGPVGLTASGGDFGFPDKKPGPADPADRRPGRA